MWFVADVKAAHSYVRRAETEMRGPDGSEVKKTVFEEVTEYAPVEVSLPVLIYRG